MKKIFLVGIIGVSMFTFLGCGAKKVDASSSGETNNIESNNDAAEKDKETEADKDETETSKPELEENNKPEPEESKPKPEASKPKPEESKPKPEESKPKPDDNKTIRVFKITTLSDTEKVIDGGEIKTEGLGVAENIKEILKTISSKYFEGKGLELKGIEEIKGKKIATINLTGDQFKWHQEMQGSAGGNILSYTLIENILQRNYKGYWIDGVQFTLNGKKVEDSGHTPKLTNINYR